MMVGMECGIRTVDFVMCAFSGTKSDDPNQEVYPVLSNYPPHTADLDIGAEKKLSSPKGRKPGQKKFGPVRLTAQFMKDACWFAYHARRLGRWTKPQLLEYLCICNGKQSRIDHIEHTASKDQKNKTVSVLVDIVPKIWPTEFYCFGRCRLPDLGMHGIAHSMIPEVMDFVHRLFLHWKSSQTLLRMQMPYYKMWLCLVCRGAS